MTKAELYTFCTSLTSGIAIDSTLFDNFLDVAQMQLEGLRPWVILRETDGSQSASPSDSFVTPKILPTDFSEFYEENPIQLVRGDNSALDLMEIPYSNRFKYNKSACKFAVDYPNNQFYIMGNITEAYTIWINYIKLSTLVSTSDSTSWIFPARFHKILGLMVAIFYRKGIDYDIFNQTLADNQEMQVRGILDIMTRWDSNLQMNMQRGKDPFNSTQIGLGSTGGGFVTM